eukprot:g41292.t1
MEPNKVDEVLNEYFALLFTKEKDMVDGESWEGYIDILEHVNMKKDALGVLKSIKVHKSPIPDEIYPTLLREAVGLFLCCTGLFFDQAFYPLTDLGSKLICLTYNK